MKEDMQSLYRGNCVHSIVNALRDSTKQRWRTLRCKPKQLNVERTTNESSEIPKIKIQGRKFQFSSEKGIANGVISTDFFKKFMEFDRICPGFSMRH